MMKKHKYYSPRLQCYDKKSLERIFENDSLSDRDKLSSIYRHLFYGDAICNDVLSLIKSEKINDKEKIYMLTVYMLSFFDKAYEENKHLLKETL